MPEGDAWSITTNSHHLPHPRHGFRSRSRRGARLSTVSLTSASPVGTAMRSNLKHNLGHEEDSNPRRLGRRDTRSVTGVPDHLPPRSSGDPEPATSNDVVAGAIPAAGRFPRCRNSSRARLLIRCRRRVGASPTLGAISRSTSGIDEETVPKTAAPSRRPECDSLVLRHFRRYHRKCKASHATGFSTRPIR